MIQFFIYLLALIILTVKSERAFWKTDLSKNVQQAEANQWSNSSVFECHERGGNLLGPFTDEIITRTITDISEHWSLSISIDIVTLYNWAPTDTIELSIDGRKVFYNAPEIHSFDLCPNPPDTYTGTEENKLKGTTFHIFKNVTDLNNLNKHNGDLEIEIKSSLGAGVTDKFWGIQNIQIFLDLCFPSCYSCGGPTFLQCKTCPENGRLKGQICECKSGFYLYKNRCLDVCPDKYLPNDETHYCDQKNPCNVRNCEECVIADQCSKCVNQYKLYRYSNKCIQACPFYAPENDKNQCIDPELEKNNVPKEIIMETFIGGEGNNDDLIEQGWVFNQDNEMVDKDGVPYAQYYSDCGPFRLVQGLTRTEKDLNKKQIIQNIKYDGSDFVNGTADKDSIPTPHYKKILRMKIYLLDNWYGANSQANVRIYTNPYNQDEAFNLKVYEQNVDLGGESLGALHSFGDQDICGSVAYQPDFVKEVEKHMKFEYDDGLSNKNMPIFSFYTAYNTILSRSQQEMAMGFSEISVVAYKCPPQCLICSDYNNCQVCIDQFSSLGGILPQERRIPDKMCACPNGMIDELFTHGNERCKNCGGPSGAPHSRVNPPECKCPDGYFDDNIQQECQKCDDECKTCDEYGCIECINPVFNAPLCQQECRGSIGLPSSRKVVNGVCECPDGYFNSDSQFNAECQLCNVQCKDCEDDKECTVCKDEQYFLPLCLYPKTIVEENSEDFPKVTYYTYNQTYYSVDGQQSLLYALNYLSCSKKCALCEIDRENCTKCNGDPNRNEKPDCLCKDGYHDNNSQQQLCQPCVGNCELCVSDSICLKCKPETNMIVDQYTQKCICKQNFKYNSQIGICENCFILQDGCVTYCPQGMYQNELQKTCDFVEQSVSSIAIFVYIAGWGVVFAQVGLFCCLRQFYSKNYQQIDSIVSENIKKYQDFVQNLNPNQEGKENTFGQVIQEDQEIHRQKNNYPGLQSSPLKENNNYLSQQNLKKLNETQFTTQGNTQQDLLYSQSQSQFQQNNSDIQSMNSVENNQHQQKDQQAANKALEEVQEVNEEQSQHTRSQFNPIGQIPVIISNQNTARKQSFQPNLEQPDLLNKTSSLKPEEAIGIINSEREQIEEQPEQEQGETINGTVEQQQKTNQRTEQDKNEEKDDEQQNNEEQEQQEGGGEQQEQEQEEKGKKEKRLKKGNQKRRQENSIQIPYKSSKQTKSS